MASVGGSKRGLRVDFLREYSFEMKVLVTESSASVTTGKSEQLSDGYSR